uniref:Uncharacterized protein n=1 Tax=viral metagenome TaxID=1070528 RepID=A0A6M3LIK5_9ZZZZ
MAKQRMAKQRGSGTHLKATFKGKPCVVVVRDEALAAAKRSKDLAVLLKEQAVALVAIKHLDKGWQWRTGGVMLASDAGRMDALPWL